MDNTSAFSKRVDELGLSVRGATCLRNDGIIYIGQLVEKSEALLLRMPNFGRKSLNEIKEVLHYMNLHLGMDVGDWTALDAARDEEALEEATQRHIEHDSFMNEPVKTNIEQESTVKTESQIAPVAELCNLLSPAQQEALGYRPYKFRKVPEKLIQQIRDGVVNTEEREFLNVRVIDLHAAYATLEGDKPQILILRGAESDLAEDPLRQKFAVAVFSLQQAQQIRPHTPDGSINGKALGKIFAEGRSQIENHVMYVFTDDDDLAKFGLKRPALAAPEIIPAPANGDGGGL